MNTGAYISGAGHVALILWALLGGIFLRPSDSEMVSTTEVSLITAAELAAMQVPDVAPQVPQVAPEQNTPEVEDSQPQLAAATDAAPEVVEQPPVESPQAETEPVPLEAPEPQPAQVGDEAPEVPVPLAAETVAGVNLQPLERPVPEQAPRVAPLPTPEPPQDALVSDDVKAEAAPAEQADQPVPDEPETAPEAATTEIVTEAEKPEAVAPAASVRPKGRPERNVAETPKPDTSTPPVQAAVNNAVAEAARQTAPETTAPVPTGPPLNFSEKDAFRIAVSSCWNVDVGSKSANVTVVIGFSLDQSGKVVSGSLKMVDAQGGDDGSIRAAFDAGRRAILRCQKNGYALPRDKYAHWRDVEVTFNPSGMRMK